MDRLLENLTRWARAQPDIRLVILWPQAEPQAGAEAGLPDLRLRIYSTDPDRLTGRPGWLDSLDEVWAWVTPCTKKSERRIQVLFSRGRQVDLSFCDMRQIEDTLYHAGSLNPPFSMLENKDGMSLQQVTGLANFDFPGRPAESSYVRSIRSFFYHCGAAGKEIAAENNLAAIRHIWRSEGRLHEMLAWHLDTQPGMDVPPEFIAPAESRLSRMRPAAGPGFDDRLSSEDIWQTLTTTVGLYRRIAREIALQHGFEYPAGLDDLIGGWLADLQTISKQKRCADRPSPAEQRP